MRSVESQLESLFRSLDIHGHKANLNFKGDASFKTRLGACLTVLSVAFLIMYTCFRLTLGNSLTVISQSRLIDLD